jgi:hypothetical protein
MLQKWRNGSEGQADRSAAVSVAHLEPKMRSKKHARAKIERKEGGALARQKIGL